MTPSLKSQALLEASEAAAILAGWLHRCLALALPFILAARSVLDFWTSSDRVDILTCPAARDADASWLPRNLRNLELHGREIRVGAGGKDIMNGSAVRLGGQDATLHRALATSIRKRQRQNLELNRDRVAAHMLVNVDANVLGGGTTIMLQILKGKTCLSIPKLQHTVEVAYADPEACPVTRRRSIAGKV